MSGTWNFILVVLAVFLPPLAVFFKHGLHHQFWINILLTLLGYFPGLIHAWYEVLTTPQYYYVPASYASNNPLRNVEAGVDPVGQGNRNAVGVAPVVQGYGVGTHGQGNVHNASAENSVNRTHNSQLL